MPTLTESVRVVPTLDEFFASLDPYTYEPPRPEFGAIVLERQRLAGHEGNHRADLPDGTPFMWSPNI